MSWRKSEDSFVTVYVACIFFSLSVWWKADNVRESEAASSAEPPAHPQTGVCEPSYHGNRVPATLQGAAGGAAVGFLQQLLSGQDSECEVRRWAGYMEVPAGRHKVGHPSVSVEFMPLKLVSPPHRWTLKMKPESNSLNFWVSARMSWRGRC